MLVQSFRTPEFRWSPDGAWITYAVSDVEYNSDVWIVAAEGGTPYNVSRHPDSDASPRWSPDGKRLVWLSKRHADTYDVWGVWLAREDHERWPDSWLRYWTKNEKGKSASQKAGDDAGDKPSAELPVVRIDFENLWERVGSITSLKGNEDQPLISADSKHLVFKSEHEDEQDLYVVRWDGKDLKRLTTGGQEPTNLQFLPDGKTLCYLDKDGVAKRVSLEGKAGDPMPYEARYDVNLVRQRAQVFDEAWRHIDLWYYDPEFHGVDWSDQRKKYRPLALAASHEEDFADVFRLMLGELNSSHVWYSPKRDGKGEATGWIGVLFDPAADGPGIRIREVLPHSPAARVEVGLKAGDRIVSVDGTDVAPQTNVYGLFAETANRAVHLEIQNQDGSMRRVTVRPVGWSEHRQLRYDEWVRQRRHMVDQASSGRLGYLHIKGMNIPSFEDFERDLYAAASGKEALIIDVRSNSGGWTTDYLLAVLTVRRHAYTLARGVDSSTRAYPQLRLPLSAWTRPALALCNEESYSNAEIFSHAFRTLGRGPLVGVPTFGGVISTGSVKLLDGGSVSLPVRGWFVADTGRELENNGAVPDVVVEQPPEQDTASDRDTQLEKAVEVLLSTLETDPRAGAW